MFIQNQRIIIKSSEDYDDKVWEKLCNLTCQERTKPQKK